MRLRHQVQLVVLSGILMAVLSACGGDGGGTPPPGQVPTTITVSNPNVTLTAIGETVVIAFAVRDQNQNVISNASVTALSDDTGVASVVSTTGNSTTIRAEGNGTAMISLSAGSADATASVTVNAPIANQAPTAVINANPLTIPAGDNFQTVVTLDGTASSDPDSDPLTFTWNVPDGMFVNNTNTNSQVAEVTFPGNAPYQVTLTVDDGRGGSDQAQVTIALGPAAPTQLQDGVPLAGIAGGAGSETFFTFEVPQGAGVNSVLEVALLGDGIGDADLFVRFGQAPTQQTFDCRSMLAGNLEACSIAEPASGTWHIMVLGSAAFNGLTIQARLAPLTTLQDGVQVNGLAGAENSLQYFRFDVPPGPQPGFQGASGESRVRESQVIRGHPGTTNETERLDPQQWKEAGRESVGEAASLEAEGDALGTLAVSTFGGTGNPDLFLSRFPLAALVVGPFDCTSNAVGPTEFCQINDPTDGRWYIVVFGDDPFTGLSLLADFTPTPQPKPELVAEAPLVTPAAPTVNDALMVTAKIRNDGTAASGQFAWSLKVDGGEVANNNIADIPAAQMTTIGPVNIGMLSQGAHTVTIDVDLPSQVMEAVDEVTNNTATTNVNVNPAQTGMITVQKVIQSSGGGAPDNPAMPSLMDFEFQVKNAGTANVVATLETDVNGVAKFTLPVGNYDIMESDNQGLTDMTALVQNQVVTNGGNINVNWINKQAPPAMGMITVQKVIQSSGGGAPDNPAMPSLMDFEFQVKNAGTANVVATLETDVNGVAKFTLPVGNYDIMESDNQGLTDMTMLAQNQMVTNGGNINVNWINKQAPPGPTGKITVTKQIQSSGGGAPDNPASPSLNGFQFQVKNAGTMTVVTTIMTDGSGMAMTGQLPVGDYDIVESNNQGLTDFTMNQNNVSVTNGGDAMVNWINRQAAPVNQPPTAVINASPTSVPTGDGHTTVVMLNGKNSTDPEGDPLTYSWTVPGGNFVNGTNATSAMPQVTFPGAAPYNVALTVNDGNGVRDPSQTTQFLIALSPALPAPSFTIDLQFINAPTGPQLAAFNAAKAFWESVILGDTPGFLNFSLDLEECRNMGQTLPFEFVGNIDDIRILVLLEPIDEAGGTLGSAGPCHAFGGFPFTGVMRFDTADLATLEANGDLSAVIRHEMAHVLGIGTLWNANGLIINPSCPGGACTTMSPVVDTRYTGAGANAAYNTLDNGGSGAENTPVEGGQGVMAGPGTRDAHWRETTFVLELMTGFLNGGQLNPVSKITIGALADLGYVVDFSQAEPYMIPVPPGPSQLRRGSGRIIDLGNDISTGPIFEINELGQVVRVLRR